MNSTFHKENITLLYGLNANINFLSAMTVGISSSVLFHPIDRALYLKQTDIHIGRRLLSYIELRTMFHGLPGTFYQRIMSQGSYFYFQGELNTHLYPYLTSIGAGDKLAKTQVGLAAGALTGLIANPSYAIKFYTFRKGSGSYFLNAHEMFKTGGILPFFKGIRAGIGRDTCFGAVYETARSLIDEQIPAEKGFVMNFSIQFASGLMATTLCSPLNYARNVQFNSKPHELEPRFGKILLNLFEDSKKNAINVLKENSTQDTTQRTYGSFDVYKHQLAFLRQKLMIGAGTVRVGAGMACGQLLFDFTKDKLGTFADRQNSSSNPRPNP